MAVDNVGVKTLLRQVARPKPLYPSPLHPSTYTRESFVSSTHRYEQYAEHTSKYRASDSSDDDLIIVEDEIAYPSELQCGECLDSFTAYSLLAAHLTHAHGNHDVFECGLCLKFFICLIDLEDHLLDGHLRLDRGNIDMRLCNINEDEISHFMTYAAHREQVRLQCPYCSCEFGKLALYQHHMSSAHHGRAWGKDGLCDAVLKVTPTGPLHQSTKPTIEVVEENLRPKVFTCNYCNKQFFGKEPMRRHAAQHHTDNPFQCRQCSCYFSSESRLEEHMTKSHLLLDQENVKKNLHGDIIGTTLEDVLNANDSLATPIIRTTMKKSSFQNKSNKAAVHSKIPAIIAPMKADTPSWKGHKRSSSEDSLPDEDHPLHKLLVLCRYATREQKRMESESEGMKDEVFAKEEEAMIESLPHEPIDYSAESGKQFMLDTLATCNSSDELLSFARGFLSVHLLLIHIAALSQMVLVT